MTDDRRGLMDSEEVDEFRVTVKLKNVVVEILDQMSWTVEMVVGVDCLLIMAWVQVDPRVIGSMTERKWRKR